MSISSEHLYQRLKSPEPFYFAWSMLPSLEAAEMMAWSAFEGVLVDLQHGLTDLASSQSMIGVITMAGKPSMVRIPVGDFSSASRALDFGAQAIVAPMVNNVEDAKAFVNAVKYPPIGERSYGPFRASQLYEIADTNDYVARGNKSCLALVMIETAQALKNLENILTVDGIDGVFVGPADMSLSLLGGEKVDMDHEIAQTAFAHVAKHTLARKKIAGIYAPNASYAKHFAQLGYRMIAVGADMSFLADGMADTLKDLGK